MDKRQRPAPNKRTAAAVARPATDRGSPWLWFDPPTNDQDRRHQLTRDRVVAEALAVIAHDGVQALTMRRLAARLGVVPGALYHHVRNKERLHDLVLDNVLAEVDFNIDPSLDWTEQLRVLAHRLRQVLEAHPGVAGILKTRDPLGPHSLALAEAFLEPLQAAGFADREAGLAFFLLVDYTIGFAVGGTPDLGQRATRPRPGHQGPAPPVLPVAAPRPLPGPGRPGRPRLGRQPRRAVHRRPGGAGRWVGAGAHLPHRPPPQAHRRPRPKRPADAQQALAAPGASR